MIPYNLNQEKFYSSFVGYLFHFCFVYIAVIWLLHLFHLFLGVVFPFWSKFLNEKKWKVRLHIVEVLGSIVLCSLAPTVYVSVSTYLLARFPTVFIFPGAKVIFYTIVLPLAVTFAVGTNLIFFTFFTIHKVNVATCQLNVIYALSISLLYREE